MKKHEKFEHNNCCKWLYLKNKEFHTKNHLRKKWASDNFESILQTWPLMKKVGSLIMLPLCRKMLGSRTAEVILVWLRNTFFPWFNNIFFLKWSSYLLTQFSMDLDRYRLKWKQIRLSKKIAVPDFRILSGTLGLEPLRPQKSNCFCGAILMMFEAWYFHMFLLNI